MQKLKTFFSSLVLVAVMFGLVACSKNEPSLAERSPQVFRILAGSELKDIAPEIIKFGETQGVQVKVDFTGSLDAVDILSGPHLYDEVWVSHGKYLQLVPAVKAQIKASEKTMYSRVILGVKPEKVKELGWTGNRVSWHDVIAAVKAGKLKLAMTSPAASNTGFVTLIGVAAELAGKGDALEVADIPHKELTALFSGISLTSGSTGDLATKFKANPQAADALIAYEATIEQLTQQGLILQMLTPKEGVVTADYPLMLLTQSMNPGFHEQLVAYLRSPAVQQSLVKSTGRIPLVGGSSEVVVNDLPFPASLKVVDSLLDGFMNQYSRPISSYYILDKSGSMGGARLKAVQESMTALAVGDGSVSGRFSTFRARERVSLTLFSGEVGPTDFFELTPDVAANKEVLARLQQEVAQIHADGATSVFSAVQQVYAQAQQELKAGKRNVSIVLLTDGEQNAGIRMSTLLQYIQEAGAPYVPVYSILYGESNVDEMTQLSKATKGQVFDARKVKLRDVMRSIRNYQ
jgi:Ca-activated chloride channel homolog